MGRKKKNKIYQNRIKKLEKQRIQDMIEANEELTFQNTWDIIDIIEFSNSIEKSQNKSMLQTNKNRNNLLIYIVSSLK